MSVLHPPEKIEKLNLNVCKECLAKQNIPVVGDKYIIATCDNCKQPNKETVIIPKDFLE